MMAIAPEQRVRKRADGARSVLVVDAGFLPTTRRMSDAVRDGVRAYVTPIASRPGSAMLAMPKLGRQIARRALPDDLAARARRAGTATEAARVLLSRAGVRRFEYELLWRRNIAVDAAASRLVTRESIVIGQYGACAATFARARALGATTILDHPIAREQAVRAILNEERQLRPDFADTIASSGVVTRPRHLARLDTEVALADTIVVGSSFAAASFAGIVDDARLRVVPYGVDTRMFSPATTSRSRANGDPLRVLFAGQITQRKGIGYLLDAMRLLDPRKFELTLAGTITGNGAGLRRYDGLYRHVDAVAASEMPAMFHAADVLVLPSLAEGSALVVLEAMASGVPVIVTANTGADAMRDGVDGFVVPLRSAEAIAACLTQLHADEELRSRTGVAARRRASEFGWARFSREFRQATGFDSDAPATEAAA